MSEANLLSDARDKSGKTMEPDYQDVLRAEFAKLHKEYRNLENRRHTIAKLDANVKKRTDRIMPLLERDQNDLQNEMHIATSKSHLRRANYLAKNMQDALKTFDMYQHEIAKKIKQIGEIEHHVDRITDKVIKQRFKLLALHGLSKSMAERERELCKTEDKLYHYTCSFNVQVNENKNLREEIMDYLMERGQFFSMHNSLKRQIAYAKKKMLNIVQQAITTYDNRDEAMSKVKALREREAKELKQHGLEIQEYERTLHHDKSILDFIKLKLRSRPALEDAIDRRIRMGSAKERELDAILKKYNRSFKRILAFSNTSSILDLVDKYNYMDTYNFETFKYITDLNNECEVLRQSIESLKSNIEDVHTDVEKKERKQRQAQQELQLAIISQQEDMELMQKQMQENKSRQIEVFGTMGAALVLADAHLTPIMRLLGNKEGINENNIRLCFTQLDIKITEIKVERDRLRDIKSNTNTNTLRPVLAKGKQQPTQGGPFVPKVLVTHGESVDEEDTKIFEQEPYYYMEMREYVIQKAIDDRLIDPSHHSLSVSASSQMKTIETTITPNSSRKTLIEKIRQSQAELGGRRRRKRNHELEQIMAKTGGDQVEAPRNKTGSIPKFGSLKLTKGSTKTDGSQPDSLMDPSSEEEEITQEIEDPPPLSEGKGDAHTSDMGEEPPSPDQYPPPPTEE